MTGTPYDASPKEGVVATNSPDYLRRMFANLSAGTVSVPLRDADDRERLERTGTDGVFTPAADHGWLDTEFVSTPGPELAQISFTSGTEGAAKAVYLSRSNLHDVVERLSAVMHLSADVREYIGVPVYHSFGYGRARAVLHAGGRCFVPSGGFDLAEIRRMLQAGEINAISAVPSLWRVFLQSLDLFGAELDAVRWVEIGSQYMSPEDKAALRATLPNACIVQHYGLTEASRTTFQRIDTAPAESLGAVGSPTGDVHVRLDASGCIQIKGPHVALGIDDGTQFQAQAPEAWLSTKDQGHLDGETLYFDGRADDVINISGIKLAPDLIEASVRKSVATKGDFGVVRRHDPLRGEGILLVLTPESLPYETDIVEAVDAYAKGQGVQARSAIRTHVQDSLPRTATGKLQRKQLVTQDTVAEHAPHDLAAQITRTLGADVLSDGQTTFHQTGGDSLAHMQMSLALERAFGRVPDDWEAEPLAGLVDRAAAMPPLQAAPEGTPPLPTGAENLNPPDLGFWQLVREDYRTNDASVAHQGFLMLFVHRFGNWRMSVRPKLLRAPLTVIYRVLNKLTQLLFGMKLDYTVKVGRRVKLEHFGGMILGAREIGDDVILRQNTTLGIRSTADARAKPVLGNRVDVGAGAVIVGNIRIGDNSIIGANTVVYSNIPPNSVVSGVPGRIIGTNARQNPSPLQLGTEE